MAISHPIKQNRQGFEEEKKGINPLEDLKRIDKVKEAIDKDISNLENVTQVMKQTQKYYQLNGWDKKVPINDFVGKEKIKEAEKKLYELANSRVLCYDLRANIIQSYFHQAVWRDLND